MAALATTDRVRVWAGLMARLSLDRARVTLTKPELRAAVDAVDQWLDANAASFNAALPAAARTGLTAAQKAQLLAAVVLRRTEQGA